jgi:hypothetical protein
MLKKRTQALKITVHATSMWEPSICIAKVPYFECYHNFSNDSKTHINLRP